MTDYLPPCGTPGCGGGCGYPDRPHVASLLMRQADAWRALCEAETAHLADPSESTWIVRGDARSAFWVAASAASRAMTEGVR